MSFQPGTDRMKASAPLPVTPSRPPLMIMSPSFTASSSARSRAAASDAEMECLISLKATRPSSISLSDIVSVAAAEPLCRISGDVGSTGSGVAAVVGLTSSFAASTIRVSAP